MESIYQFIFKWALNRWRKVISNDDCYRKNTKVTAHALMRYAERIDGYDFELVEQKILKAKPLIEEYGGNGKIQHDGIIYVVKGGQIMTLYKAEGVNAGIIHVPLGKQAGGRWTF